MDQPDSGTGQHGDDLLGDLGEVDGDTVAFLEPQGFERVCTPVDLPVQLGVREDPLLSFFSHPNNGDFVFPPTFDVPVEAVIGNVAGVITGKRGKVIDIQQKGILTIVIGEVPASETFDLSEVMRGQTAGKAMWNTHFKAWTPAPKSIQTTLLADIRKRKGLSPDPPTADEFIDKD